MKRVAPLALVLALVPALSACSDRPAASTTPEPGAGTSSATPATFAQEYTTRGVIAALPGADRPGTDLSIQHEAIPEFVDGAGQTVGMRTMTMPFPHLAPGVTLDGLAQGDKVRFTFGVAWNPSSTPGSTRLIPSWTVTMIEKLPPDTPLELGAPPASP